MSTYQVRTLQPAPSMNHDITELVGTYAEAVAAAQSSWRKTQRATSVVSGTYCWYSISGAGETLDRNTVGAPVVGKMNAEVAADCRTHGYDGCPVCFGQEATDAA